MYLGAFVSNPIFASDVLEAAKQQAMTSWSGVLTNSRHSPAYALLVALDHSRARADQLRQQLVLLVQQEPMPYQAVATLLVACLEGWATVQALRELLLQRPATSTTEREREIIEAINARVVECMRRQAVAGQLRADAERQQREMAFERDHRKVLELYDLLNSTVQSDHQQAQDWAQIAQTSLSRLSDNALLLAESLYGASGKRDEEMSDLIVRRIERRHNWRKALGCLVALAVLVGGFLLSYALAMLLH
jgi:hypothetical protein